MGVSQNEGYLIRGLHIKDYSILGSILGYPNFGKLPNRGSLGGSLPYIVEAGGDTSSGSKGYMKVGGLKDP